MTASGRTLSRLARGQAGDTWLLPACERWSQDGWPGRETQEGVEAFASQPPVVSEAAAACPSFCRRGGFRRASV